MSESTLESPPLDEADAFAEEFLKAHPLLPPMDTSQQVALGQREPAMPAIEPEKPTPSEFLAQEPLGQVAPGNIPNLFDRKELANPDGSHSTTSSIGVGTDAGETVIPTVVDGQRMDEDNAKALARETGANLGTFVGPESGDLYAHQLHEAQAQTGFHVEHSPLTIQEGTTPKTALEQFETDDAERFGQEFLNSPETKQVMRQQQIDLLNKDAAGDINLTWLQRFNASKIAADNKTFGERFTEKAGGLFSGIPSAALGLAGDVITDPANIWENYKKRVKETAAGRVAVETGRSIYHAIADYGSAQGENVKRLMANPGSLEEWGKAYDEAQKAGNEFGAGVARTGTSLLTSVPDLVSASIQGTFGGALGHFGSWGHEAEQNLDAALNSATGYLKHNVNWIENKAEDKLGVKRGTVPYEAGGVAGMAAIPIAGMEGLAPAIAKGVDRLYSGASKVAGAVVKGSAKVGSGAAAVAGRVAPAVATAVAAHELGLGTAAEAVISAVGAGVGWKAHLGEGLAKVFSWPFKKMAAFGQIVADSSEAGTISRAAVNQLGRDIQDQDALIEHMATQLGEDGVANVRNPGPNGKPLVPDALLKPEEFKFRQQLQRAADLAKKKRRWENIEAANKVLTAGNKFMLNAGAHVAAGAAIGAGLSGAGSPPGDIAAVQQGAVQMAGLAGLFAPFSSRAGMRTARAQEGMAALRAHGLAVLDPKNLEGLTPAEQQHVLELAAAQDVMGGKKVTVLSPEEYEAMRRPAKPAAAPEAAAEPAAAAPEPVESKRAPWGHIDNNGDMWLNRDYLNRGTGFHELRHNMILQRFGEMLRTGPPELMKAMEAKYAGELKKAGVEGRKFNSQEERDAEIARIVLSKTPLHMFFGGERGGDVVRRVTGNIARRALPGVFDRTRVDKGLGAPTSPGAEATMRKQLFGLGEKLKGGGKAMPDIDGGGSPPVGPGGPSPQQPPQGPKASPEDVQNAIGALRTMGWNQKDAKAMAEAAAAEGMGDATAIVKRAMEKKANAVPIEVQPGEFPKKGYTAEKIPSINEQKPSSPIPDLAEKPVEEQPAPVSEAKGEKPSDTQVPSADELDAKLNDAVRAVQPKIGRAQSPERGQEIAREARLDALRSLLPKVEKGKAPPRGLHAEEDPVTHEVVYKGDIDPADPVHAKILEQFGYHENAEEAQTLADLQANIGKGVYLRSYNGAGQKGFAEGGADLTAGGRNKEYKASKPIGHGLRSGEVTEQDKAVTPLGMKLTNKGVNAVTFDHGKFFSNLRDILDKSAELGETTGYEGLTGDALDKAVAQDLRNVAYNHSIGADGAGTKTLAVMPDMAPVTKEGAPRPVDPDRAAVINMAFANESAKPPGELEPNKSGKPIADLRQQKHMVAIDESNQALGMADLNQGYNNQGETNALRDRLVQKGYDTSRLKNTISNIRPDMVKGGVHDTPAVEADRVHAHGFNVPAGELTKEGLPRYDFQAAGFHPGSSEEIDDILSRLPLRESIGEGVYRPHNRDEIPLEGEGGRPMTAKQQADYAQLDQGTAMPAIQENAPAKFAKFSNPMIAALEGGQVYDAKSDAHLVTTAKNAGHDGVVVLDAAAFPDKVGDSAAERVAFAKEHPDQVDWEAANNTIVPIDHGALEDKPGASPDRLLDRYNRGDISAEELKNRLAGDDQLHPGHDQTETPEFKKWFGESKVRDEDGAPIMVFSGHSNTELYGNKFDPKKGTSGGFYATEDPQIASNYAMGKFGVREYYENGDQYRFRLKNGKWNKKLWQMELSPEQQAKARDFFQSGEQGINLEERWKDNAAHDEDARRALARGGLRDLQSIWKQLESDGYNIAYPKEDNAERTIPITERQVKNTFEELLDHLGIEWQSHDWMQPGVMPLYLSIKNPLDAEKPFPADLMSALKKRAKGERAIPESQMHYKQWTKDYPLKQWIQDIESGSEFWSTQVPNKAIQIIKQFGYDGIKERGLKGVGDNAPREQRQINWVAFDPEQIKSATGNRGTFDPNNPDITFHPGSSADIQASNGSVDSEPGIKFLPGYHGSPHDFEKFDKDHIGTGEGAQAYGYGLYFAEHPGVAKSYVPEGGVNENAPVKFGGKPYDAENPRQIAGLRKFWAKGDTAKAIKDTEDYYKKFKAALGHHQTWKKSLQDIRDAIDVLKEGKEIMPDPLEEESPGHFYTVDLDVKPEELLDWDKPFDQQSDLVKKALADHWEEFKDEYPTGGEFYAANGGFGQGHSLPETSAWMNSLGIKGIRYLDQMSRSQGNGTHNFVMFDDSRIKITHKDGQPVSLEEARDAMVAPAKLSPLQDAIEKFEGSGEIQTVPDLVDHVEGLIAEGKAPESLQGAVDTYRQEAHEDFTQYGGRGDVDSYEQAFLDSVKRAAGGGDKFHPGSEEESRMREASPAPGGVSTYTTFAKKKDKVTGKVTVKKGKMPAWFVNPRKDSLGINAPLSNVAGTREKFFERLDQSKEWLKSNLEAFRDPKAYLEFMRRSGVRGDITIPPTGVFEMVNNPDNYIKMLGGGYHGKEKTVPGVVKSALEGLDGTQEMARLLAGEPPPPFITAIHHLWGTLSRRATPLQHEAMWLRLLSHKPVLDAIQASVDGTFNLTQAQWKNRPEAGERGIVYDAMQASPGAEGMGNQVTSNANDFYGHLGYLNGHWDEMSNVYAQPNSTLMGREFWKVLAKYGNMGIRNKVNRLIGITFGKPGVPIDRWKYVEFWLPTLMKAVGAKTPAEFFKYADKMPEPKIPIYGDYGSVEQTNPAFSQALSEGIDTAFEHMLESSPKLRQLLGNHANSAGLHWVGWNAIKNEPVGHSSLDLTKGLLRTFGRDITADKVHNYNQNHEHFTEGSESGDRTRVYLSNGAIRVERGISDGQLGATGDRGRASADRSGARGPEQESAAAQIPAIETGQGGFGTQKSIPELAQAAAFPEVDSGAVADKFHPGSTAASDIKAQDGDRMLIKPDGTVWKLSQGDDQGRFPGDEHNAVLQDLIRELGNTRSRDIARAVVDGDELLIDESFNPVTDKELKGFNDSAIEMGLRGARKINSMMFGSGGIETPRLNRRDYTNNWGEKFHPGSDEGERRIGAVDGKGRPLLVDKGGIEIPTEVESHHGASGKYAWQQSFDEFQKTFADEVGKAQRKIVGAPPTQITAADIPKDLWRGYVRSALEQGKPVPENVVAEYKNAGDKLMPGGDLGAENALPGPESEPWIHRYFVLDRKEQRGHLTPAEVTEMDQLHQRAEKEYGSYDAFWKAHGGKQYNAGNLFDDVETSPWWKEEMKRRGLNPARTFNDVDLGNPSVRQAIENDPTLTDAQKQSLLATGSADPIGITDTLAELDRRNGRAPQLPGPYNKGLGKIPEIDGDKLHPGWDVPSDVEVLSEHSKTPKTPIVAVKLDDGRVLFSRGWSAHVDASWLPRSLSDRIVDGGFVVNGKFEPGGDLSQGLRSGEKITDYYDFNHPMSDRELMARDRAYEQAVRANDHPAIQRHLDEAAREAGFQKMYRGVDSLEDRPRPRHFGATFLTDSKENAVGYAGNGEVQSWYVSTKNTLDSHSPEARKLVEEYRGRTFEDEATNDYKHLRPEDRFPAETHWDDAWPDYFMFPDERFTKFLAKKGYDSFTNTGVENTDFSSPAGAKDFAVINWQKAVKSAEPITRDDAGNVIPPSQRFNRESDDVRFHPGGGDIPAITHPSRAPGMPMPAAQRSRDKRMPAIDNPALDPFGDQNVLVR